MQQYLNLLKHIKENGVSDSDRTGTGTVSIFGYQMRFDLQKGFPLLTTKKLHLRSIIHELLWFLKGETNIKYLKDNNVTIWDEWADENGELGPIYGKQWRSWENLVLQSEDENIQNKSIDQISWVINRLKTNPSCRRIIVSAWNVSDIPKMKLAPCHCLFQFYTFPLSIEQRIQHLIKKELYTSQKISKDTPEIENILNVENIPLRGLSCQLYQRSADVPLGVGFNIASYALLTMMIAQCVNMIPSEFIWTGGNCHIYNNQWDGINQQLERKPLPLPTMKINPNVKNIFDFKYEDFTLENYTYHPAIKMPVAV